VCLRYPQAVLLSHLSLDPGHRGMKMDRWQVKDCPPQELILAAQTLVGVRLVDLASEGQAELLGHPEPNWGATAFYLWGQNCSQTFPFVYLVMDVIVLLAASAS
jgi:hypothetical protein